MEPELRHHLVACATAYAAASGKELVTVGRLAAGDWRFFDRIQGGASFTARKYDEIMRWLAAHWPEGAPWPDGVPAPDTADAEPSDESAQDAAA